MDISLPSVLVFLVALAGHAALLVTLLNRVYSYALPCRVLRLSRSVHDVLMIGGPIAFLALAGLHGPAVLRGGSWTALPAPLLAYLVLCLALALLGMPAVFLARMRHRLPAAQRSNHSQVVDVARPLGRRPLARGRHALLARLPGNQIFELEVSEKEYVLPRLPADLDGLSILHLSDLHFIGTIRREFFEAVVDQANALAADLVCITGDLIDRMECLEWLPSTLGRLQAPLGRYFILGNHDWFHGDVAPIRRAIDQLDYVDVAGRWQLIESAAAPLVLAGTELPWLGQHPDLSDAPADAFRILLSHTPDHFAWAQTQGIDLMLAGHLHGGQVLLPIWGPVYSPSRFGNRYVAGPYHEGPTLMYVHRGLSGIHPVRYGARPEVTKLVLRSK